MLLSQLKYFQVVAKYEHISHAAEELHVAQPSLSVTISKIEKELGVPLFDRKGRNIILNDAGKRLLAHVNFMFEQIDNMNEALAKTKDILENEFTLSVCNSMFLNGWLQDFVTNNPKIRLQQKMLSENQMIESLLNEEIDVALGEFDDVPEGISCKKLIEDEYIVIVPNGHPLSAKKTLNFEDIRNENIISLPSNTNFKIANRVFEQKDAVPNLIFEGNPRMMNKVMYLNQGILFASRQMLYMPYFYYKNKLDDNQKDHILNFYRLEDLDCHYNLSLCWKEDYELPLMAQKFIDAIVKTYPKYTDDKEYLKLKQTSLHI